MADQDDLVAIEGSERPPLEGATQAGPLDPSASVEVTVYLRPPPGAPEAGAGPMSREELAERRGATPADLDAVARFAEDHGLEVVERDGPGRRVRLRGPARSMEAAFGVSLVRFEHQGASYRGHAGAVRVPRVLRAAVVAVLGLDDRPQARSLLRPAKATPSGAMTPSSVAAAYGLAAGSNADGVCIAIVELGGGYKEADLDTYFKSLGRPVPTVSAVSVDGGANTPTGSASGPDAEVMLDVEVVGAVALGGSIAVYFAPNTDQGFADAISAAVHDTTNKPAVISVSWGGPESTYTASATTAFEAALTDASLVGTTVFVAAGDSGSSDGVNDGLAHVDYPASSPQVTGCGGTRLEVSNGSIASEVVWDDLPSGGATGGGVSATFPLPTWQSTAHVPRSVNAGAATGRGVPDVAADADPDTGYQVRVDGGDTVVGGTSAVAPLYAALTAIAVAKAGRPLGFLNPKLYALAGVFRDITAGNNGAYTAAIGWDACTGLGSPGAEALIEALAEGS
jgi:kumamolisin